MRNALQRALPQEIDNPDITPINHHATAIKNATDKLVLERELCEAFLKSPNITDGPAMDKPFAQVQSRIIQVRMAIEEIYKLKTCNLDFDEKLNNILGSIFNNKL